MTELDVTGIGNAIVDVLAQTDDAFIDAQSLVKGSMTLIDAQRASELYSLMTSPVEVSGGSAANTLAGVGSLGGKCAFIGKTAKDALGDAFREDIKKVGTRFESIPLEDGPPTARCLILVSPDAQRTMSTFLGASIKLSSKDVNPDLIQASKVTYLEGYLWDPPEAKEAFLEAARIAHKAGRKVALSLSDSFCVDRHRSSFIEFIDAHVDILFASEEEAIALYQTGSLQEAAQTLSSRSELVAITRGAEGSLILAGEERYEVAPEPTTRVEDTTGAGDLYASGFLYGWCKGFSPAQCGRLGSITASEVISHFGARPEVELKTLIPKELRAD